jgi:CheY-like chemotaxis protein
VLNGPRRPDGGKRILVIDDEATIRELIADALREAGYNVETAANGAEGLRHLRRHRPQAIVLDLMMPVLAGDGFRELMRLEPSYANIPILVVTATYGAEAAAQRIGATAWLSKPFELDELLASVARLAGRPHVPVSDAPTASPQLTFDA